MANIKAENNASVNQNLPNKLLSCLYSQRRTGKFCDVILNVGSDKFSVHSCVLASFSSYFNDIYLSSTSKSVNPSAGGEQKRNIHRNDWLKKDLLEHWSLRNPLLLTLPVLESSDGKRKLDCPECTAKVLDFMYLGKIQIQNEHVDHVKSLSTVLEVAELLLICEKYYEKCESQRKRKSETYNKQPMVKKLKDKVNINTVENDDRNNDDTKTCNDNVSTSKGSKKDPSETNNAPRSQSKEEPVNSISLASTLSDSVKPLLMIDNTEKKTEYSVPSNIKSTDGSKNSSYTCSICEQKFPSSALLWQHRQTHSGRLHTCYTCRYSSYKAFELLKHLLEADHQETVCSLCVFEAETAEKLKDHLKQHIHPKPFFCSICNVRFQTRATLNTHTPKHSTEMPFSCSVCNRGFKWKQGLQSHMAVHTPEKKHLCSECGFSTAYQSTFKAHTLVHTSNLFSCAHDGCNFKSVRKQNFVSHLMTHNKEKPYQCEICGQSYSQAKNLRRHAVKHDAVAEEFLEHCPLCSYQTMRLDKLKIHFKRHHPEGDEKLLNLQRKRRKHRMPSVPIQRDVRNGLKTVNDATVTEKTKQEDATSKHSGLTVGKNKLDEVQLSNGKNDSKQFQANPLMIGGLQLPQDVTNGNSTTFIITGFNTQLPNVVTPKTPFNNFQMDSALSNDEGTVILLDNLNTIFVPTIDKCSLPTMTVNNDLQVPERITMKQSDSLVANMPLKTDQQLGKVAGTVLNPINSRLVLETVQNRHADNMLKNSKIDDNTQIQRLFSGDNFAVSLNSINDTRMQRLTAIVEDFSSGEIPQRGLGSTDESSVLSATVGSLINEQLQALTSHKDDSSLDVLNNNMIQELFADEGPSTEIDVVHGLTLNEDSTNTLDILSKDVPQLVGNEESLSAVLDHNKDKMLLCHETIADDTDIQHPSSSGSSDEVQISQLQVNEDSDNPVLQTLQSFESIFESFSLPEKI